MPVCIDQNWSAVCCLLFYDIRSFTVELVNHAKELDSFTAFLLLLISISNLIISLTIDAERNCEASNLSRNHDSQNCCSFFLK